MGDRPIDDAVDGLSGLRDEAGRETDAVMDLVRGDLEALRRPAAGETTPGQRTEPSEMPEPAAVEPTVLSVSSTAEEDVPILRDPPPDTVIVVDDTAVYRTDSLGRVVLAEVVLRASWPEQPRNARAQQIVKDKLPGDHAGHLIARVLGGIGEAINLTPMEGRSVNMGQYRALENEWRRAIDRGQEVDLRIRLVYDDDTARPAKFVVWYQIEEVPYKETIKNVPADARER